CLKRFHHNQSLRWRQLENSSRSRLSVIFRIGWFSRPIQQQQGSWCYQTCGFQVGSAPWTASTHPFIEPIFFFAPSQFTKEITRLCSILIRSLTVGVAG